LIGVGALSVVLGVLGMFLPLLPTTVFLLLAAWCFSRSSPRFHAWLLNNRVLGRYISAYHEGRGMSLRDKWISLATLWLGIGVTVVFFVDVLWVRCLLLAIAAGVTIHLVRLPTYRVEKVVEPSA
jgi:uncharacterized membrane protein YbaN (DUF454 family)